jgi:hypothetical protein
VVPLHLWQTAVLRVPTEEIEDTGSDTGTEVVVVTGAALLDVVPLAQLLTVTVETCVTGTVIQVVAQAVEVTGAGHDVAPQPLTVRVTGKHFFCPKSGLT